MAVTRTIYTYHLYSFHYQPVDGFETPLGWFDMDCYSSGDVTGGLHYHQYAPPDTDKLFILKNVSCYIAGPIAAERSIEWFLASGRSVDAVGPTLRVCFKFTIPILATVAFHAPSALIAGSLGPVFCPTALDYPLQSRFEQANVDGELFQTMMGGWVYDLEHMLKNNLAPYVPF